MEERILLLALRGRDAQVIEQLLGRQGRDCRICASGDALAEELALGAGAALVTEESLAETGLARLLDWLREQPSWSDFPIVLLVTKRAGRRPKEAARVLEQLGNVVLLERPIHSETLSSAVDSALRARRRQYEARRHLEALATAEERLRQLNGTLETRIDQRTHELARANNQLMQEIGERARAQAALVQSQKMEAVGQLTGGIAHDFNNLLTVIDGNLELIQRRANDEKISSLAEFAHQAADRAAKLTRQLLAFSRSQRLTLRPVDVNALITGMNDLLTRAIGPEYGVAMDLDPNAPWALADTNQLELALLNLAVNARDAMPDGGVVRIRSACRQDAAVGPGDYAVIAVADTGVGIPRHLLDKIFDPFFTTKPIGKGTGLGLSQVYGIARQSGGTVRVESAEGKGAQVEIWLRGASALQEPEILLPAEVVRVQTHRARVLVVEDDPGVRRFIVECLEMLGYQVTEACDGREGLARLNAERPELLIVDFAMPGLNGVEVVAEARDLAPDMPIILATGYADMEAVYKVIDPDHVLRKPFQIDDLERAVRGALVAAA